MIQQRQRGSTRQCGRIDQFSQPPAADGGENHRRHLAVGAGDRQTEIDARHTGDAPGLVGPGSEAAGFKCPAKITAIAKVQALPERQGRTQHPPVGADDAKVGQRLVAGQQALHQGSAINRLVDQARQLCGYRQHRAHLGHQLGMPPGHTVGHRLGMRNRVLAHRHLQALGRPPQQGHHGQRHQQHHDRRDGAQAHARARQAATLLLPVVQLLGHGSLHLSVCRDDSVTYRTGARAAAGSAWPRIGAPRCRPAEQTLS